MLINKLVIKHCIPIEKQTIISEHLNEIETAEAVSGS